MAIALGSIDTDVLFQSIRRAAGESVMSPPMGGKLADAMRHRPMEGNAADSVKLSPREKKIIVKLARGDSNKEIARELDLSESTVKIHV